MDSRGSFAQGQVANIEQIDGEGNDESMDDCDTDRIL